MKRLLEEIHRRSLWQVVTLYLAGGWVVLEVTATIVEQLFLPGWVFPTALGLVLFGLPIILTTAFVQKGIRSKPETVATGLRSLLTWRKALWGGAMAFMLLGIGTAGYTISRAAGIGPGATLVARGVLETRDPLILADFEGRDSVLARTATRALRIDLDGSEAVALMSVADLRDAMERMRRDPNEHLDLDLAQEVAIREGIKGVIGGSVDRAGSGFVFSVQLMTPTGADVLVSHRETADDDGDVIPALNRLSRELRERIGESLGSLRASPRLSRRTTPSLEALSRFSDGLRAEDQGDLERALAGYEEAVRLDTAFAAAYRQIGIALNNLRENRARMIEAYTRAFELRSELPEFERLIVEGTFYGVVVGDLEQWATIEERIAEIQGFPGNNLGVAYEWLGHLARAEEAYLDLNVPLTEITANRLANVSGAQIGQGKFDEAAATIGRLAETAPEHPYVKVFGAALAEALGEYDAAAKAFRDLEERRDDPSIRVWGSRGLARLAAIQGRFVEAESEMADVLAASARRGQAGNYLADVARLAALELWVKDDLFTAFRRVEDALVSYPLDSLSAHDRPYEALAWLHAAGGRPDEARTFLAAYESEVRPRNWEREVYRLRAQAQIALAEGDPRAAIAKLERMNAIPHAACQPICTLPIRGQAYEMLSQPDSAIAAYERYVTTPRLDKIQWDALYLPKLYERLGQLYDEQGDLENAAKYYAMFVELWADADEDLQPRVRAAQERLEEIVAERG